MAWHISNRLFEKWRSSQVPEAASLAESSSDGKPSVQSNGNPTPLLYLQPDRTKAFSRLSRFGMTFKPTYICTMGKKEYIYGPKLKCKQCGKVFRPRDKSSRAKYCSYACNNASRRIHHPVPCVVCGTVFTPIRNGWGSCSRKCGTAYRLSRHVQDPMTPVRKKLAVVCCGMIARSLRGKTDKTRNLLGYSVDALRSHIESKFVDGMSWENYGRGKGQWSIDHIRPISKFPPTATIKEINALENLQPLWHSENCRKRNKWNVQ